MTRRTLLGAVLAAAAFLPAPAANAAEICVKITVGGSVSHSVGTPCITVGGTTFCDTHSVGFPPTVTVQITVCSPMPLSGT